MRARDAPAVPSRQSALVEASARAAVKKAFASELGEYLQRWCDARLDGPSHGVMSPVRTAGLTSIRACDQRTMPRRFVGGMLDGPAVIGRPGSRHALAPLAVCLAGGGAARHGAAE